MPATAHLPAARAAVLGRLWGALRREDLTARTLTGDEAAAAPFAVPPTGLTVRLDGVGYTDPAELAGALGWPERFRAELANSVGNLALARTAAGPAGRTDLADVEALVVDGHPLHPLCRTRTGMSAADQLAYAPEHTPTVDLDLMAVPAAEWTGVGLWPWRDGTDYLVPVHPWQREHHRPAGAVHALAALQARPLMSLRTLALDDGSWHVKTALNVQMTSAVRIVSAAATHNGPPLSEFVAGLTDLRILAEPATGPGVVLRRPPALAPGETVAPLGALCAGAKPLLAEHAAADPDGWMADLVAVLLRPLLDLLGRGIALEAHGQNTLVVLRDGRPVAGAYRDFGGVRISPALLARHGLRCPDLRGDLRSDDPAVLRATFAASVLAAFAEIVAVLARTTGAATADLWRPVAAALDGTPLRTGPWALKATTAMRLAADPLTPQWAPIPNPLEPV